MESISPIPSPDYDAPSPQAADVEMELELPEEVPDRGTTTSASGGGGDLNSRLDTFIQNVQSGRRVGNSLLHGSTRIFIYYLVCIDTLIILVPSDFAINPFCCDFAAEKHQHIRVPHEAGVGRTSTRESGRNPRSRRLPGRLSSITGLGLYGYGGLARSLMAGSPAGPGRS